MTCETCEDRRVVEVPYDIPAFGRDAGYFTKGTVVELEDCPDCDGEGD